MLRHDHQIMIEQGESNYATLRLMDKREENNGKLVSGTWKQSTSDNATHTGGENLVFTSANPQYYYWEWDGPHTGNIRIGVKMPSASHNANEKEYFQVLFTLYFARKMANGKFEVASILAFNNTRTGAGNLTYNVKPHFNAGSISWTPIRYERE